MSATVRYPATLALIDGLLGPAILSAQCSFGYDQRTSTAVIRVATLPAQTLRPLTTRVILFLTSDQTKKPVLAAPRFWGYLVEFDYTLFPRSIDLLCRGPLVKAEFYECTSSGGLDLARFTGTAYLGDTDENMVRNVLQAVGLSTPGATVPGDPHFQVQIGEADGTHPTTYPGTGTGKTLGVTNGAQFVWAEGQTALSYIEGIDAISCVGGVAPVGYRTFEQAAGTIIRAAVSAFAGTRSPYPVFTEGVDIESATGQVTILDAKNRANVTGYNPGGVGAAPVNYSLQQSNPLLSGYVTAQVSSQLIEKARIADPGTGISCEDVAAYTLNQQNRQLYKYTLTTPRDDLALTGTAIVPGSTIQIQPSSDPSQPSRLGLSGFYYVQNAQTTVDEHGAFSVTLIVLGGPGSTGAVNAPPGVDFTIQLEKELVVVAGVETPLYTLHGLPVVSALTSAIVSYSWIANGGANVTPTAGTLDTFTTTTTSLTNFTVTLSVTDAAGLTGSTTKTAPPDDGATYLVRRLFLAGTDTIDDYPASTAWRQVNETGAVVVANAPLWAGLGNVWGSPNDLATAPTLSNPFATGTVTALWVETNVNRSDALAGSSQGHIAVTSNTASTWVDLGPVPDGNPILKCLISGAVPTQFFALTLAHLYRSDNAGAGWVVVQAAAGGETFTDWSLSFARGMIAMSGGRLLIDLSGTTQTFPAGPTTIEAVTADIRADRFYCYDQAGNTYGHVNAGDTALVATAALNLGGGTVQPRGLWRDGTARGLLYYAAGTGGAWKSLDGFGSAGGYKQLRKPGVGNSPAGAVYTQVGADGLLSQAPISGGPVTVVSDATTKAISLGSGGGSGPWCETWGAGNRDMCNGEWTLLPSGYPVEQTCSGSAITAAGNYPSGGGWVIHVKAVLPKPVAITHFRADVSDFSSNPNFLYMYNASGTLLFSTSQQGGVLNWGSGAVIAGVSQIEFFQGGGDREGGPSGPVLGDISFCGNTGGSPYQVAAADPVGWMLPSGTGPGQFDDSAWGAAVSATTSGETLPPSSTALWHTALPATDTEVNLFRRTFTLASGAIASATLTLRADDLVEALYLNAIALDISGIGDNLTATIAIPATLLVAGGSNILAAKVANNGAPHAWLAFSLAVS